MVSMKIKKYFKTRKNAFLAAALTGILFYLIFESAGLLFSGTGIFLHDDLWAIYPAEYLLNFKTILSGNFNNYSFCRGMGESISFPYYTLLNPFCWVLLIIPDVNAACAIMAVLKLMLAGYTFQRMCAKLLNRNNMFSVVFACSYALCGYTLIFYYNIHYLDALYVLPLLVLCLEGLLKHGKVAPVGALLAYQFIICYYSGFMISIFIAFLTIAGSYYLSNRMASSSTGSRIRFVGNRLLKLVMAGILAVLVSFAQLFPSAYGILTNATFTEKSEIHIPLFENGIGNGIFDFFKSFLFWNKQSQSSTAPATYFGILTLIFCILFFVKRKNKNKIFMGTAFAFLLVCTFVPYCYFVIHMFDMPDVSCYRFAYFYAFLGCICAVEGASQIFVSPKYKKIGFLVSLCVIAEIAVAGVTIEKAQDRGAYENKYVYRTWKNEVKQLTDETQAKDEGLYRFFVDKMLYENESAYFTYPGITEFNSVVNEKVRKVNEYLGFSSTPKILYSIGSTPVTRMLYGQKYSIQNQRDAAAGDAKLTMNDLCLPIVYSTQEGIKEFCLEEDNPFANQNSLLSCLVGDEVQVFTPVSPERIEYDMLNMEIAYTEGYGTSFRMADPTKGVARIDFEVESDLPVYMRFNQFSYEYYFIAPYIVGETQLGSIDTATLYAGPVMKFRTDTEKNRVSILLNENTVNYGGFTKVLAYEFHEEALEDSYLSLTPTQMEHVTYEKGHITGDIEIIEGREVLMTSIPYHKSWHVLIDGKEVETYAVVNDAFLAADITPGHHDIEMYYTDDIGRKSLPVSIVGIVILTMLTIYEKKKYKEIKK